MSSLAAVWLEHRFAHGRALLDAPTAPDGPHPHAPRDQHAGHQPSRADK